MNEKPMTSAHLERIAENWRNVGGLDPVFRLARAMAWLEERGPDVVNFGGYVEIEGNREQALLGSGPTPLAAIEDAMEKEKPRG